MTITINGTTGIAGVDGSASVPAFQGNDTNTGIYYPVANEVAASANGSAVWNASGTFGFKNRLINGDFNIWQRGTSFTGNFTNLYGADRWSQGQFQTGPQSRQTVATAGVPFNYACRISSSSTASVPGGSRMALGQMVESTNCYDLRNTPVTLSFWVRFSNATFTSSTGTAYGNFHFQIWQYTTTTDSNFSSTAPDIQTLLSITNGSLPTVWTKYSITVTTSAQLNNIAARFNMEGLGSTASDGTLWYEVTGVQIEKGSVATSFDNIPIGTELMLCQRYFQTDYVMQQGTFGYFLSYYGGTNAVTPISQNQVPMRTSPTATLSSTSLEYYSYSGVWTSTTLQIAAYSPSSFFAYAASDGDGRGKLIRTGSGGTDPAPYYLLNAEL